LEDAVSKIKKVLQFKGKTDGRKRLQELNLDSRILAQNIVKLYKEIIDEK
jgi:hypothetical protein